MTQPPLTMAQPPSYHGLIGGINETFILTGAFGLTLTPGGDSVKAVSSSETCDDKAVTEVIRLSSNPTRCG